MEEIERVYEAALEALRQGEPVALATVIETEGSTPRAAGAKMLIRADGRTDGSVGGGAIEAGTIREALEALGEGQPRQMEQRSEEPEAGAEAGCRGRVRIFIEVLAPSATLLIIGGGHVGQALAELAGFLGYRVIVLDERPEMVTEARFPTASMRLSGPMAERLGQLPLTSQTSVVFLTPHHWPDEQLLAVLAGRPVAYVGMIGSKRRARATLERAAKLGVPSDFLARIHTPIGLGIGAETPREIAVSIAAEIIAVQRGQAGDVGHMSLASATVA